MATALSTIADAACALMRALATDAPAYDEARVEAYWLQMNSLTWPNFAREPPDVAALRRIHAVQDAAELLEKCRPGYYSRSLAWQQDLSRLISSVQELLLETQAASSGLDTETEWLHRRLDGLAYAARLGFLDDAAPLAFNLYRQLQTPDHTLNASAAPRYPSPMNACLPPLHAAPLPEGTPLQKLRALCAVAGEPRTRAQKDLHRALQALLRHLDPLSPERAEAVMLAARRHPEGGTRNLVGAFDADLLRQIVHGLMLLE
jgi:hypothetical protein